MKKIKTFLLTSIIFILVGCEYKPIYSTKNINFTINEIIFSGQKKINSKIKNNLKRYQTKKEEYNKVLNLEINSIKNIDIVSKDSKGNPFIYSMKIEIDLKIKKNDTQIFQKKIREKFNYKITDNKFDLKQYEKTIESTIVNKIIEKIINNLYSI